MAVTKPPKPKTKKKKKTGKHKLESIRTKLSAASTFDTDTLDLSSADKIKEVLTAVVKRCNAHQHAAEVLVTENAKLRKKISKSETQGKSSRGGASAPRNMNNPVFP